MKTPGVKKTSLLLEPKNDPADTGILRQKTTKCKLFGLVQVLEQ
jgi:hypothetical protein